jgi:tetratricopeptide (TPR) repeat protein
LRTASQAIEEFKKVQTGANSPAVALDPDVLTAGLRAPPPPPPPPPDNRAAFGYLPESCESATPDNANQAIEEYKKVQIAANSAKEAKLYALKSIGSLYFLTREFDQSRDFYRQATEMNPNDPENYYMLGVMAWFDTYRTATHLKASAGLRIDDPYLKTKESQKTCESVRSASGTKIDSGLDSFQKALALRPEYWEAMAYMTLLYLRKADIECGNQAAHHTDIKMANDRNVRTLASCKPKAEKQTSGSSNGNSK